MAWESVATIKLPDSPEVRRGMSNLLEMDWWTLSNSWLEWILILSTSDMKIWNEELKPTKQFPCIALTAGRDSNHADLRDGADIKSNVWFLPLILRLTVWGSCPDLSRDTATGKIKVRIPLSPVKIDCLLKKLKSVFLVLGLTMYFPELSKFVCG